MVFRDALKPACWGFNRFLVSRYQRIRFVMIDSIILHRQDVRAIGRYEFVLLGGSADLMIGIIVEIFHSSGSLC